MTLLRLALLGMIGIASAQANLLIFDSFTGATSVSFTGSTPRTYMGMRFDLDDPGVDLDIVAADFYMVSATTANYTNIELNVAFWDTYNGAATPVFSDGSGIQTFNLGSLNAVANNYYTLSVIFSTPIHLTGLTSRGIGVNYRGDTGGGLAVTTNLTSLLRFGTNPIAVGASPNGYYRAGSRTDLNFLSTDFRTLGGQFNQGLALKLYVADAAAVPEPGTFLLAAGALTLVACKLRLR
jgi:hypothetical protein